MSRRKRGAHHKTRRRRHRSVGAMSVKGLAKNKTAIKLVSLAAGAFLAGGAINDAIDKANATKDASGAATTRLDTSILTIGEVGIGGLLLLAKTKGTAGLIMSVAGGLIAGAGLRRAAKQFGIITGFQSVPVIGRHRMAGFQSVPVIGQRFMPPQLSGRAPAQLQGFRVNGYIPTGSGVGTMGRVEGGSGITNSGSNLMG